jgi:hypothetical protein
VEEHVQRREGNVAQHARRRHLLTAYAQDVCNAKSALFQYDSIRTDGADGKATLTSTVRGRMAALRTQYWSLPTNPPGETARCVRPRPLSESCPTDARFRSVILKTLGVLAVAAGSTGGARTLKLMVQRCVEKG